MAKCRHPLDPDWSDLLPDRHASPPMPDVEFLSAATAYHELQKGIGAWQRDTKPKRGKSSCEMDLPEEVGLKVTLTESNPQVKFVDRTDAAFSEELGFMSLDKCKRSGENGLQLKEERRRPREKSQHLAKISSREPPSVRYPKKDKQRSLSCKFSDFIFPGISSSHSGKTLPRRLSKRFSYFYQCLEVANGRVGSPMGGSLQERSLYTTEFNEFGV